MPTTPSKPASRPRKRGFALSAPRGGASGGSGGQVSGISRLEASVAAGAIQKLVRKEPLTAAEHAALRRHEKDKEERLRWQYYASIPQKHWRRMSGRQTKVINEQAQRYGLPFGGPVISLPELARALHDFLAENAVKLARDDDALMSGPASPALERYRAARAALAELELGQREGQLLPRDETHLAMARIAAILRSAGETLGRQFGSEAREILDEAMDDAEAEIARWFEAAAVAGQDRHAQEQPSGGEFDEHEDARISDSEQGD